MTVVHKHLDPTLAATMRIHLKRRDELPALLSELCQRLPPDAVAGPPFCTIQFISNVTEGYEADVGFPVNRPVEVEGVTVGTLPPLDVLALVHRGPLAGLRECYAQFRAYAAEHGIASDEFCREVYLEWEDPEHMVVEAQFVVHDWHGLFASGLERVLGAEAAGAVLRGRDELTVESSLEERFCWTRGAMERLERLADDDQRYEVLSRCAHVFPAHQIERMRAIYEEARARTGDALQAVDAVIAFMEADRGGADAPRREGNVLYAAKKPRDPEAYARAQDDRERAAAYCFCPLLRGHLEDRMPLAFCYCGAGWFRRQWEGAIGEPLRVEIVHSLLKGDDRCEFAIHLPARLP